MELMVVADLCDAFADLAAQYPEVAVVAARKVSRVLSVQERQRRVGFLRALRAA